MSTITGIDAYSNVQTGAPDDGADPQAGHIRAVSHAALNNTRALYLHSILDTTLRPSPGNTGTFLFGDGSNLTIGLNGTTGNIFCRTLAVDQADGTGRILMDGAGCTFVMNNTSIIPQIAMDGDGGVVVLYDASGTPMITMTGNTGIVAAEHGFFRASTSYERVVEALYSPDFSGAGNWTFSTDNLTIPPKARFIQNSNLINYLLPFVFRPPHGATLTGAKITIDPANGHTNLPATKPRLRVYACDQTIGDGDGGSPILDVTDAPASIAAYEAQHTLTATGGTHVVDRDTYLYLAIFTGEIDASFGVSGLQAAWPRYVFTRLQVGEE